MDNEFDSDRPIPGNVLSKTKATAPPTNIEVLSITVTVWSTSEEPGIKIISLVTNRSFFRHNEK